MVESLKDISSELYGYHVDIKHGRHQQMNETCIRWSPNFFLTCYEFYVNNKLFLYIGKHIIN